MADFPEQNDEVRLSGETSQMSWPASYASRASRARELWRETLCPLLGAFPIWRSLIAAMRAHPLLLLPAAGARPPQATGARGGAPAGEGADAGLELLASLPDMGAARLAPTVREGHLETAVAALASHAPSVFSFASSFVRCVRVLMQWPLALELSEKCDAEERMRAFLVQSGASLLPLVPFDFI